MKKLNLIILAILVVLISVCVFAYKALNKPAENNVETITPIGSAIQNAMYYNENENKTEPESTPTTTLNDDNKQVNENSENISVIKKAVKKVQKAIKKDSNNLKNSDSTTEATKDTKINEERRFTPEEEELLKKIPRTDEVVVDKEIKIKSSGKYLFK